MKDKKELIIDATIGLMIKTGNINLITMREIASQTGVGLGAINYHFQSKNNLINIAVRKFIADVISKWDSNSGITNEDEPPAVLRKLLHASADFLAAYPRISRISILFDLEHPDNDDNTMQTINMLIPFAEACLQPPKKQYAEQICRTLIASIQQSFLRSYERETKQDFFNPRYRQEFIDGLIRISTGGDE